ncbi:MAG TPA: hypothetical protein VHV83_02095 [Armatimonadota bacterium]|nr:hypothetical protein [Armatimonadota bacterium]
MAYAKQLSAARCRGLITASVQDLAALCHKIPSAELQVCCLSPWPALREIGVPIRRANLDMLWEEKNVYPAGVILTADVPTVPIAFVATAVRVISDRTASWVHGATMQGGWYLIGWGQGAGTATIPSWNRLFEPAGLHQAAMESKRGTHATHTATFIDQLITHDLW